MKKILIVLLITVFLFLLFGCRHDKPTQPPIEINWSIEVSYLDNIKDTLYITTKDDCGCDDSYEPELYIYDGVSTLRMRYEEKASYVKSFRVLSKETLIK